MEENKKQPQSTSEQRNRQTPKRRAVAAIGSLICTTR